MVNKTPLRLVAIEERPDDERDDSAAPVDMMSDADAITRRVPDCEQIAAHETMRDKTPGAGVLPKGAQRPIAPRSRAWRKRVLLLAAGVATVAATAIVLRAGHRRPVATKESGGDVTAKAPVPAEAPKPVLVPSLAPAAPAPSKIAAEIIRLEISAEPVETVLSLDGNMLAGHRLNLQVPKDHGVHVVSASAPGYVPFNQQVSFTSDVVLSISLRRSHGAPSRQAATRTRSSRSDVNVKRTEAKPAAEQPVRQFAPGMHLEGPPTRAGARQIDERNPYNP